MAITAKDVNDLRQRTGLGMMECKQALSEANGDMQAAIDLIRTKGLAKMDGRTDRASAEGRVAAAVTPDGSKGVLVEVNTETDFTAKTDSFLAMVAKVAAEALKQPAGDAQKTDAMQHAIDDVRLTTKENVQFARGRVAGGPGRKIGSYVHHNGKLGVVIEIEGDAPPELLKELCQHIAAASPVPLGVSEADVPADVVAKEREIAKAQAIEQGKPAAIAEKMVEGKIRKFYEETVLTQQLLVTRAEEKKKVKDALPKGATIKSFIRYQLGAK
ncbi:MAG: translation elongation factor Ts [Planctomycetes bacterium]|nr:translation elongation factor Ts [Planctomycetota bacterium]